MENAKELQKGVKIVNVVYATDLKQPIDIGCFRI